MAGEWLSKASATPFNQEEAYWRLAQMAESQGQADEAQQYQQWLKNRADSLAKDRPGWTMQRIEELRKQKKFIAGQSSFGPEGYKTGYQFLWVGWYKEAIWNYEYALTHGVPLASRFSVPEAALMYKALAKAYNAQAASLKKDGAQAEKVEAAKRLAKHNEWRLFITETRIGTNWVERILGYGH